MCRVLVVTALLGVGSFACGALPDLEFGMCGNGVWEPEAGEDCDTNSPEGICAPAGTNGACRFVCDADPDCPGGRLCGGDRICRLPVRQFRPALGSPYASVGRHFSAKDLDADGVIDIIGTNAHGPIVMFGNADASFCCAVPLETGAPTGPVTTAVMNADKRRDIVTATDRGLQVSRVDPERAVRQVAHAFNLSSSDGPRPRVVPMMIDGRYDVVVAFIEDSNGIRIAARTTTIAVDVGAIANRRLSEMAFDPVAGDIDGSPAGPTEEVALAFEGDDEVQIFGLSCTPDCRWIRRASVATTVDPIKDVVIADADGDGFRDLFIVGDAEIQMARNRRDSTFAPAQRESFVTDACPKCSGRPFVIADIDGDHRADFVTPGGIVTTTGSASPVRHRPERSTLARWSDAIVGDFDGDGRRDVAIFERGRRGIEIALGSDNAFFNAFSSQTSAPVLDLVGGDYDGDGIDDVAIIGDAGRNHTIDVAYGTARDRLLDPIEMARFGRIETAQSGLFGALNLEMTDFRADLLVQTASSADAPANDVAILIGAQAHQMVSPALLLKDSGAIERPLAVVGGRFDDTSARDDLIAVVSDALWLYPTDATGGLNFERATRYASTLSASAKSVLVEAANLDADPFDEVVILTGAQQGAPPDAPEVPRMYIVDVDGDGVLEINKVALPVGLLAPSGLQIALLDDLTRPAIIVTFAAPRSSIVIFETYGGGRVQDAPTVIESVSADVVALQTSTANIDDDPDTEILVLTQDAVYSIDLIDGVFAWGPEVPLGPADRQRTDFASMRAVDFDDDGLADIAIADEDGFFVYRALERAGEVTE